MFNSSRSWIRMAICFVVLIVTSELKGQDIDLKKMFQEGIPTSPVIGAVYNYANTMLEHGRDNSAVNLKPPL